MTREQIIYCADLNIEITDRNIDVHMTQIRKKLAQKSNRPITTIERVGYAFRP